jgi:hypothetical protein
MNKKAMTVCREFAAKQNLTELTPATQEYLMRHGLAALFGNAVVGRPNEAMMDLLQQRWEYLVQSGK